MPPRVMPMLLRLANPQRAKVVMLSALSWRAQKQGIVTSAHEQPQSAQSSAPHWSSQTDMTEVPHPNPFSVSYFWEQG